MNFWIPSQMLKHFRQAAYYYYYMFLVVCILYCCSVSVRCCLCRIICKVLEVNNHLITSFLLSSWSQSLEAEDEEVSGTKANLKATPQWPSLVRSGAAKLPFQESSSPSMLYSRLSPAHMNQTTLMTKLKSSQNQHAHCFVNVNLL